MIVRMGQCVYNGKTMPHLGNLLKLILSFVVVIVFYGLFSLHQETICDALAQNVLQNFVSKSGSSHQMHARWQHQIPSIPILRVGWGGGFAEVDAEFKFAKIQNSYVEGGGFRRI